MHTSFSNGSASNLLRSGLRLFFCLAGVLFISISSQGQMNTAGWGKAKDLENLSKRQLVVELLDETCPFALKGEKDLGPFVSSYNTGIRYAIENYFKWNSEKEVLYKTTAEINNLDGSVPYAYFRFKIVPKYVANGDFEVATEKNLSDFMLGTYKFFQLHYIGSETKVNRQEFTGFLPYLRKNTNSYTKVDLAFAVKLIQEMMQEMVDSGSKVYTKKYLKSNSKSICKATSSPPIKLIVGEDQLHHNVTKQDVESAFGDRAQVVEAGPDVEELKTVSDETAVLICIPYDYFDAAGSGGLVSLELEFGMVSKLIVNAKTLEIIAESGVNQITGPWSGYLNNKDLNALVNCLE